MFRKIKRYLKNPYWEFGNVLIKHCPKLMPDKYYLSVLYYKWYGKKIDWENPRTFNEKLQWLKLYDRNPLYPTLVDKYEAKKWVADKIGEQYVVPTFGVWNHFDEIDFDKLPNQFVLKCTHDSGSVVICNDKATFDKDAAKAKLEDALKKNFYWCAREWPYKGVKHRIMAEELLVDDNVSDGSLCDYKLMCFNGIVKCSFVCTDRNFENGLKVTFFDDKWQVMPFERHYHRDNRQIPKPLNYESMVSISKILSASMKFVRVDFYEVQGKVFFGELTFFPGAGFEEFNPEVWDEILGDWIELKKN